MERRIEEYLKIKDDIIEPYENHYGHGCSMGFCDKNFCGRAFVSYETNDDFNGKDILEYNGNKLYTLNDYLLYITNVHEPWANGEIIKNDLTTQSCYIGRINDIFVIESSIRDAIDEFRNIINKTSNNEKDVAKAFVIAHPCYDKEYDWEEMVFWHSIISTSCAEGRKDFSFSNHKKPGSKSTPRELVQMMKNYGVYSLSSYIEEYYLEKEKAS